MVNAVPQHTQRHARRRLALTLGSGPDRATSPSCAAHCLRQSAGVNGTSWEQSPSAQSGGDKPRLPEQGRSSAPSRYSEFPVDNSACLRTSCVAPSAKSGG